MQIEDVNGLLSKSPKLPLSDDERRSLRNHKMTIRDILDIDPRILCSIFDCSMERAQMLIALCDFQRIPSVGPRLAECVADLGYSSIEEVKGKDGVSLVNDLEQLYGCWMDPCVEDVMRLVADYTENRNDEKRWWDFTDERKQYRNKHGYPINRPTRAWNDN